MLKNSRAYLLITILVTTFSLFLLQGAPAGAQNSQDQNEYEPGFYYTIQKGDTLWDLSQKFYDSNWVWPALWGQNQTIKNPHRIYPGQRIRLYQKTEAVKHQDKPEPTPETVVAEKKPAPEAAPAPKPEEKPEKKLAPQPPPEKLVYYFMEEIARVGFLKKLPKSGFLSRHYGPDPFNRGEIFKVEGADRILISQGDVIYINPTAQASPIIGSRYYIYKPPEKIIDPVTDDYAGHQFKLAGIAEITNVQEDYAVAEVAKSFLEINVGDFIMPFAKRSQEIALSPPPENLRGHVIIEEQHETTAADTDIVFLNKGEQDGVAKGQRYNLCYQDEKVIDGKKTQLPQVIYGQLMILLTQETTATAVITDADKEISPGALFVSLDRDNS